MCESQQTPGAGYLVRGGDGLSSLLVPASAAQGDLRAESRSAPSRGCPRAATLGALRKQGAGFLQRGRSLLPISSPGTSAPGKDPPGTGNVRRRREGPWTLPSTLPVTAPRPSPRRQEGSEGSNPQGARSCLGGVLAAHGTPRTPCVNPPGVSLPLPTSEAARRVTGSEVKLFPLFAFLSPRGPKEGAVGRSPGLAVNKALGEAQTK